MADEPDRRPSLAKKVRIRLLHEPPLPIPKDLLSRGRPMGESFIRRAGADFGAATRSPWLYVIGLALTVVGVVIGGPLGALLLVAFAVVVFLALLVLAPFRQRNELRGQMAQADAVKRGANKW